MKLVIGAAIIIIIGLTIPMPDYIMLLLGIVLGKWAAK